MNALDHARHMLAMAARDITVLREIESNRVIADEVFGFHAQQAVEKALKAWITAAGGRYDFVHDLRMLLYTLRNLGCDTTQFEELDILNPFAVRLRYDHLDVDDVRLDRKDVITRVQTLHDHVLKAVELIGAKA